MRNIILFLIILSFISCSENNDSTIAFLNEGIEQSNDFISMQNGSIYTGFAMGMEETPKLVNPWNNKAESIHVKHDFIEKTIDTIKLQLKSGLSTKLKEKELYEAISKYHKLLQKMVLDSALVQMINNQLGEIKQNNLSIENLKLLSTKILVPTYYTLQYLFEKIYIKKFRISKKHLVIVPLKRHLKQGDYYSVKISLCGLDTTLSPVVLVRKDTLKVINGIAKYKSPPNESVGVKKLNGRIEYKRTDGTILAYPFNVSYKVIKK